MSEYSRKIVEGNKSGNQCGWFALGLCFHQRECRLTHSKEIDPSFIPCALPRASKKQLLEWGLPTEESMCKVRFYHHRDESKAAYAAVKRTQPPRLWERPIAL